MGNKLVKGLSLITTSSIQVTEDILVLGFTIVNTVMIGNPNVRNIKWVLVDTGLENSAEYIIQTINKRYTYSWPF